MATIVAARWADSWQSLAVIEMLPSGRGTGTSLGKSKLAGDDAQSMVLPEPGGICFLLEKHGFEVTYGLLFERPTPLEEGENGLRNWLSMFGGAIFTTLSEHERDRVIAETIRQARPKLFHEGQWVLDYRRLRVVAKKQ